MEVAREVRDQKLREGQEIGEVVLDAEARMGELLSEIPKGSGGDRKSDNFKIDSGVAFEKTKSDITGWRYGATRLISA